ncbi:DUF1028 domain-containing protein [Halorussus lipolyticus]|uniref:DUF1028 domain-containing protein n=1 Tax=Halorussus lipolyticus TaxID=3034024 RepID=UPI0023E8286F|nr:DUF1028 domain-containing protein [Halorussus sp. DT80]
MTFSICVREEYTDSDGTDQTRFGVAVTTRLPAVGTLCPFASESGAVATQSLVNVELGRKGIEYLDDGLAVEDALQALLNADEGASQRQLHGVDSEGTFVFSGDECKDWYGHIEGDSYTVAGNLLTGESVIEAVADEYEQSAPPRGAETSSAETRDGRDDDRPLAERLVDALSAGYAEGGDKREDLHVQSAALLVERTEEREMEPYYDDLRVDATETPIDDLRETYELASEGFEMAVERYEEAYDEDELDEAGDESPDGEATDE